MTSGDKISETYDLGTMRMYRVLLVDDDPHILDTNESFLRKKGYEVFRSGDAEDALRIAFTAALDAIILDVDLPGLDGVSICRRLREVSRVPVIFLSAYDREDDRIRGLLAGGDDYVGKPYSLTELELRLRLRIQQRLHVETADVLRFDELEIDLGLREVRYQGNTTDFSALEFDLLAFLARHPGQVFSYEQLYDRVWKSPLNKGIHNLQMCIARVRQKLELLCPGRHYIETIRRKGYRFRTDSVET